MLDFWIYHGSGPTCKYRDSVSVLLPAFFFSGRIKICKPSDASECPSGSICMPASVATQHLCCTQIQRSYIVMQDVFPTHTNECSSSRCVSKCIFLRSFFELIKVYFYYMSELFFENSLPNSG